MNTKTYILLSILAAMLFAASCKDSEEYLTSAQQQKDAKYTILPYSITASISPMTDKVDSLELKTTFIEGDAIIITNSQILAVPAILTSDGCAGKEKATFTGELKIKINANLESGTTKLTAALKNTLSSDTLYNNGHPFLDVYPSPRQIQLLGVRRFHLQFQRDKHQPQPEDIICRTVRISGRYYSEDELRQGIQQQSCRG